MSNLESLYRQVIMDHYKNPRNKGLYENNDEYVTIHLNNPSCGDDINIQVKIVDGKIVDIRHQGIGCSICCSSASVMSETLKNKSVKDAKRITNNFFEMLIFAFFSGLGFLLVMFIFSSLRERIDEKSIPEGFRGIPIALITAAALAVIFARLGGII